jgi:hypothetical protein
VVVDGRKSGGEEKKKKRKEGREEKGRGRCGCKEMRGRYTPPSR